MDGNGGLFIAWGIGACMLDAWGRDDDEELVLREGKRGGLLGLLSSEDDVE